MVGVAVLCVPGMKKDADGFTDIDWCAAQPLTSWNDLRNQFMKVRRWLHHRHTGRHNG